MLLTGEKACCVADLGQGASLSGRHDPCSEASEQEQLVRPRPLNMFYVVVCGRQGRSKTWFISVGRRAV